MSNDPIPLDNTKAIKILNQRTLPVETSLTVLANFAGISPEVFVELLVVDEEELTSL